VSADLRRAAEPSFVLTVRGDRLTVKLDRIPLGRVLPELARQAGIRVEFPRSMRNDPIAESFENLPIEQGIARLLGGRSFAIFYGSASTGANAAGLDGSPQLWVLPRDAQIGSPLNSAAAQAAGTPSRWSASSFAEESDPEARLAALDQLAQRRDATAVDALAQAMVEPDESVRAKAQALFDQALMQAGAASARRPSTHQ
jgi:hypothetical protein